MKLVNINNYPSHVEWLLVLAFINFVMIVTSSFDIFQRQSRTPPAITYCAVWILLPIPFLVLYLLPTKTNWSGTTRQFTPLIWSQQTWIITYIAIWISYSVLSLALFLSRPDGFYWWPAMDDPLTDISTNSFYNLVIIMFFASMFEFVLSMDAIWTNVVNPFDLIDEPGKRKLYQTRKTFTSI